jgi:hypothetical protein
LSHVRCLLLRSTFAATAPRSAVAELGVVRPMRVLVTLRLALIGTLSCGLVTAAAAEQFRKIDISGVTNDDLPFTLHVRCAAFSSKLGHGVRHFWGGDSPNFRPQYIVTDLTLSVGGKRVNIPSSAFKDLGDVRVPTNFNPYGDAGETILIWGGGDAAGSYTAHFFFREFKLIRREIYSGFESKKPLEVRHF